MNDAAPTAPAAPLAECTAKAVVTGLASVFAAMGWNDPGARAAVLAGRARRNGGFADGPRAV